MKKVLVDTNVILDVLLNRKPHADASVAVLAAIETGSVEGVLAAHAVTTIHYLIRRELGNTRAKRMIAVMLRVFGVASIDGSVIQLALDLPLSDFEDAVTAAAAQVAACDCIITRDLKGFRGCGIRTLVPEAAGPLLGKL